MPLKMPPKAAVSTVFIPRRVSFGIGKQRFADFAESEFSTRFKYPCLHFEAEAIGLTPLHLRIPRRCVQKKRGLI